MKVLRPGGNFVCKALENPEFSDFRESMRANFMRIRTQKPRASRNESMETYLVCLGFREDAEERRERRDRLPHNKNKHKRQGY
jgi:23S rRNA (uridine2552-2'-O)-methyltransferase